MNILVFRMSSLGDLILSTSFLEALPEGIQVDWVISKEFSFVLRHHPRVRNLIEFDKSTGLMGWYRLIRHLSHQEYDFRVDLHVTLRTQLARFWFHWFDVSKGVWIPWLKISKGRFRFYGLILFKKFWPQEFKPIALWKRFAKLAHRFERFSLNSSSSQNPGHPNMEFILPAHSELLSQKGLVAGRYFVVMPSSRWKSKEWSASDYFQTCRKFLNSENPLIPVVLGREQDENARQLVALFEKNHIDHRSFLNEREFSLTAWLIKHASFYLGSDTGLAHLSEALGVRAFVIFGPTHPDLGFGPWRDSSRSILSNVSCSPCSKDGRTCFRFDDPYACLKSITPAQVWRVIP